MNSLFYDKGLDIPNNRVPEFNIDPIFIRRWSPRSFNSVPIPEHLLKSVFEAARWSMSCANEQPWLFVIATKDDERKSFTSALSERNQLWVPSAPVLGFIFAKRRFDHTHKQNRWAPFDTGAAWMAMTLQARMLGMYTHGMAGFDRNKAYEVTGVSRDDYEVQAAFVVGRYGDKESLPDDIKAKEFPNERKPLDNMLLIGKKEK